MNKYSNSILLITICTICTSLLYGCKTNDEHINRGNFDNKELNIAITQVDNESEYWYDIVERFEKEYSGVKVNMSINPKIGEIIRPQIESGESPDFIYLDSTDDSGLITSMINNNELTNLTDVFESKAMDRGCKVKDMILNGVLDSKKFSPYGDKEIYLAPFTSYPMGLIYNKSIFEKKGWSIPETWDEFFELDEELKKEENYVDIDGVKQKRSLLTYPGLYPSYLEILLYAGIANNPNGLDKLKAMFKYEENSFNNNEVNNILSIFEKIVQGDYLLEGTQELNHIQAQQEMMLGKALFIPSGLWIEEEMNDFTKEEGFDFGIIAPPGYKCGESRYVESIVEQFVIPKKAKNPELAKEFLKFLYTDESVELLAEKGSSIYALKQAGELTKDILITEKSDNSLVYNSYKIYEDCKVIIPDWTAIDRESNIVMSEIFNKYATEFFKGIISKEQWIDNVEKIFSVIRNGQNNSS